MVPIQTWEMKDGDPLRICVEKYAFLPVDKAAFKGNIPNISGMIPLDNFAYYVKRKLFIHNLGHAAVAYLGMLKGYTYIADAIEDPDILYMVASAMRESAAALNCENPAGDTNLVRGIDSLLYRFSNRALGDTCARVGEDPARKLGENDRIIGALKNCENYGLPAIYISAVAAAAALILEKTISGKEDLPNLSDIMGLSSESKAHRLIMTLGTMCASASVRGEDAVSAMRRAAVKHAGDITIL
jgi:mannitol-1-phosphate 5-dehydrogenase